MKILLLLPDNFSDSLLATPLLRCVHRRFPDAQVYVRTGKEGAKALVGNPSVQQVFNGNADAPLVETLKAEAVSFAIDLPASKASRDLIANLNVESSSAPQQPFAKKLYQKLGWRVAPKQHLADHYFEAVAPWGIANDGLGLDFFIPKEAVVQSHDIPHSHYGGFLCLSISASQNMRPLPLAFLQALCKNIHHPIILLGAKENGATGKAIAGVDDVKIYNACGKFSPAESADLIRQAKLLLAGDVDAIQVAATLRKEVVVLGEEKSFYGKEPYYGEKFLQRVPLPYDIVPIQNGRTGYSTKQINVDDVVNKVALRLGKKKQ